MTRAADWLSAANDAHLHVATGRNAAMSAASSNRAALNTDKPHHHKDGLMRLSKVMSELGLCSRREADE